MQHLLTVTGSASVIEFQTCVLFIVDADVDFE